MSEKIYIKTVKAKESQYGVKLAFNAEELIAQIKEHKNDKGYINLELKKRKDADKFGNTHYLEVDTYKPESKEAATKKSEDNGLPF